MDTRRAYLQMIRAFPGGWDAMSGAMGMSKAALENRVYERKGQGILVETAMQMQAFSGTTHFAEAVAQVSGGCFVRLPDFETCDRDDLLAKFNELYVDLGDLSKQFQEAIKDGEIDAKEQRELEDAKQKIHQALEVLLALSFSIFCRANSRGDEE